MSALLLPDESGKTEFLVELVNTSAGIYQLLLAGIKGVALGADFDLDILLRAARLYYLAAGASDGRLRVIGMDPFLQLDSPLSRNI